MEKSHPPKKNFTRQESLLRQRSLHTAKKTDQMLLIVADFAVHFCFCVKYERSRITRGSPLLHMRKKQNQETEPNPQTDNIPKTGATRERIMSV
jgi:hypothetical protein